MRTYRRSGIGTIGELSSLLENLEEVGALVSGPTAMLKIPSELLTGLAKKAGLILEECETASTGQLSSWDWLPQNRINDKISGEMVKTQNSTIAMAKVPKVSAIGEYNPSKDYTAESDRASQLRWRRIDVENAIILDLLEYTTIAPKERGPIREKLQGEARELQALMKSIDEAFGYQLGGGSRGGYVYNPYPIGFEHVEKRLKGDKYEIIMAAILARNDGTLAWPMLTIYPDGSINIVESDRTTVSRLLCTWTHDYGKSDSIPLTDEQILQDIKMEADGWKVRKARRAEAEQVWQARWERVKDMVRRMSSSDRDALLDMLDELHGTDTLVELLRQTE